MEKITINGITFVKDGKYSWRIEDFSGINVYTQPTAPEYAENNYGVNWSGCGTKSVFDTVAFAARLQAAATLAAQLNFTAATSPK